jgi:hypothetical protein
MKTEVESVDSLDVVEALNTVVIVVDAFVRTRIPLGPGAFLP